MSVLEITRTVAVEVDGLVGLDELEEAALACGGPRSRRTSRQRAVTRTHLRHPM